MKLELTNGEVAFFEQNNTKLVELDNHTCIVGDSALYGVTEFGERIRLSPYYNSISGLNLYRLEYFENVSEGDVDSFEWVSHNTEIVWDSVPVSMYADNSYNFDNLSVGLVLITFFAFFVVFMFRNR